MRAEISNNSESGFSLTLLADEAKPVRLTRDPEFEAEATAREMLRDRTRALALHITTGSIPA
jgi:hypothetical protein